MASPGHVARRRQTLSYRQTRQCHGKTRHGSRKIAEAKAKQWGQRVYRCETCHGYHLASSEATKAQRSQPPPLMTLRPGGAGVWTAARLQQAIDAFRFHFTREPSVRVRSDARIELW